jgi:hypothetical protein
MGNGGGEFFLRIVGHSRGARLESDLRRLLCLCNLRPPAAVVRDRLII